MSARYLSQCAEAPVSSIYHHFGCLEHLSLASQYECLAAARDWTEGQLAQLDKVAAAPHGVSGFFAHVVDEWTGRQIALAFAWRECLILADRNSRFREPATLWRDLWHQFWVRAGEVFGLGPNIIVAERVFETESLYHLIQWHRIIDRAALEETARGVAAWLTGTPAPPAPWREFAHAEASRTRANPPPRDDTTARIMAAAASLISEGLDAALTHRATAEHAGVTLGTVSHRFPTKQALLNAAVEGIYAATIAQAAQSSGLDRHPITRDEVLATTASAVAAARPSHGRDSLFLIAARDPSLATFGAQLRYLRGTGSREALQAIMGPDRAPSLLEAALFSAFVSSQMRTYAVQDGDVAHLAMDELLLVSRLMTAAP